MLHHYNYTSTLSQFLSYHHQQLEEQTVAETNEHSQSSSTLCEELKQQIDSSSRCKSAVATHNNNKSFTIAAILGLKSDSGEVDHSQASDLNSVVNLSVHHQTETTTDRSLVSGVSRLQLPVRHHSSSSVAVTGHYTVGHGCTTNRHTGKMNCITLLIIKLQSSVFFFVIINMKVFKLFPYFTKFLDTHDTAICSSYFVLMPQVI